MKKFDLKNNEEERSSVMKRMKQISFLGGWMLAMGLTFAGENAAYADLVFDEDESQLEDRIGTREAAEDDARFEEVDSLADVADSADILLGNEALDDPTGSSISALPRATSKLLKPVKRVQSKSDLLRRERMRQELKNEDMIQTRLEESRLSGEIVRTKKISKTDLLDDKSQSEKMTPMEVEVVSPPVNATQDQLSVALAAPKALPSIEPRASSKKSWMSLEGGAEERLYVSIRPVLGATGLLQPGGLISSQAQYGLGVGLEVGVGDWFAIGAGYRYGRIGINNAFNYNQAVTQAQSVLGGQSRMTYQTHRATVEGKVFFVRRAYRIRPFVGGGLGYQRGSLDYTEAYQNLLQTSFFTGASQFQALNLDQFLGTAQGGVDIQISKNLGLTFVFDYAYAFATNVQATNVGFNQSFFNPVIGFGPDAEKQATAQQLQNVSFWSLSAGATFTF